MKNLLQVKVLLPVLALGLFLGVAGVAHAYLVTYDNNGGCTVAINGQDYQGSETTIHHADGSVSRGCDIGGSTYEGAMAKNIGTTGTTGSGGGSKNVFNYFASVYPDVAQGLTK